MSETPQGWLEKVYEATGEAGLMEAYGGWAESYDRDLAQSGYRTPTVVAALVCRHVAAGEGPILDAGAGTGLMGEFHALLGYEAVEALDLSEGMLAVAARKKVYTALHRMSLGEALDLPGDRYAATTAVGVLTVGHVGPAAFDELIRVTRPGGHLIFSIRTDGGNGADFIARQDALAAAGAWSPVARTAAFASLPFAEPEVENAVFVYRKAE